MNRNWHAVTAEYNTLYNGNLALELGKEQIAETYRDNYWQILPVERMQVREAVLAPGEVVNENFAVAEEKAVKAIQRHSMLLNNSEKNPQIDEAYLLLGKARYYDQRFVPALEAFNYILHKYPLSNTINEARIWREKTNMRLEFNELAIKNLKKILETEGLGRENAADASAVLAEAYLNINALDSAVVPIKRAAELTREKNEEGRYWYITGQLYEVLEDPEKANQAFQQVIDLKRKSPRIYFINAHLNRIRHLSNSGADEIAVLEELLKLAEDRENRPYLDKIYFELAEFHYDHGAIEEAVAYYNRSLETDLQNPILNSLNYEMLGNINFDAALYEKAGAYYDSTLQQLAQNTREFRIIQKKRDNLDDVIYYENLARKNDSILHIASLSEAAQLDYFTAYTNELKENAKGEAQVEKQQEAASNYFEDKRMTMPGVPNPGSSFYFYNPRTVAYGKQEFSRIWGDRELADNWRTRRQGNNSTDLAAEGVEALLEADPQFDPQTYLKKIPKDPALLDSLNQELNFASYQLGLIYRDKFNENELAAAKLEFLLNNDPEERLELPAQYNLYKIYSELGEVAKAQALKNDIIFQHPDSRYAAILQNPESLLKDKNNPAILYEELYELYEEQQYQKVISETSQLIADFSGDEIVPKLELLKAMAAGRLIGFEAYRENLNYVALNYPQSEEGKKAQALVKNALPAMAQKDFQNDSIVTSFKLVYPVQGKDPGTTKALKETLEKAISELNYSFAEVSVDVYNPAQDFIVVHGFKSEGSARGLAELLSENQKYRIKRNFFYISTPNYRIAQIHKNIETYLDSLKKTPNHVQTREKGKE